MALISSLNHLGRVGAAAYAEDFVAAVGKIRRAFGGRVRAVHGYPVPAIPVEDPVTIRALLEVEHWLSSIDSRRTASLNNTGKFYTSNILNVCTGQPINQYCKYTVLLRMPDSLHNTTRASFVGLGWDGITGTIPPLTEEEQLSFLSVLSLELNFEFGLQLSTDPVVDRLLHTSKVSSS